MSDTFLLGMAVGMALYATFRELLFPAISRRLALKPSRLAHRLGLNGGR